MKTTRRTLCAILSAIMLQISVCRLGANDFTKKLKCKKFREALFVKAVVFAVVFLAAKSLPIACNWLNWYEAYAVYFGGFITLLFTIFLGFKIAPALSLNKDDNEKTYEAVSFLWTYPIAIVFAIINIWLKGIMPAILVAALVFALKFLINSSIKESLIETNERFVHTGVM